MLGSRDVRMHELEARLPVWRELTIWERFEGAVAQFADREFIVMNTGAHLTYKHTHDQALCVAKSLWNLGVRPGDNVAVRLGNRLEAPLLVLALARLGATRVALNSGIGPFETRFAVERAHAAFLIADGALSFAGEEAPECLRAILAFTPERCDIPGAIAWEDAMKWRDRAAVPLVTQDPRALSDVIFTSGSTGNPKGVPLTHDQVQRSAFANALNRGFEVGRRIAIPLPLCHCYGYIEGLLAVLFVGGSALLWDGKFDAPRFLDFLGYERASDVLLVPIQALKCLTALEAQPRIFPCLHAMYLGGAACPAWAMHDIRTQFGIDDIVNGYGMSEIGGATMQTVPGDSDETIVGRVGKMLPAGSAGLPEYGGHLAEYRVVNRATGVPLPPGREGELVCRGYTLMEGYLDEPEKNAECFLPGGWMRTGDIGRFDENGYLELLGRSQDVYRINGENVSPRFVERVIAKSPLVSEAYVTGVPDARLGAVGALFVELASDTPEHRKGLDAYCRRALASYQVPKYVWFMNGPDWPRTETGKIQGAILKDRACKLLADAAKAREGAGAIR